MKDVFHASEKTPQYLFTFFSYVFFNNFLCFVIDRLFHTRLFLLMLAKSGRKMAQNTENIGIVSINDRSEMIFGEKNDENVARHKKP